MLTVLKLKPNKTFTIPSTGITLKSSEPVESPVNPVLVVTSFTSALNKGTLGLSFDIRFDIYASPNAFANAYSKIYSSFVEVSEADAYAAATLQVQSGSINLIEKVQQLLFQILISQPEFADWEISTISFP